MAKQEKQVPQDEKPKTDADAPDLKIVAPIPALPQGETLRMLVIETNGTRAEVRAFTMHAQEALNILNEVSQMVKQGIANAPPLHPPQPAVPAPPGPEAKA